jgi:serine/threonine-protein kinase
MAARNLRPPVAPGDFVARKRFKIIRSIGAGGFGWVYEVHDYHVGQQVGMGGRRVALKLLDPELTADRDYVRRFLQEARVQMQGWHPHILPLHDTGYDEDRRLLWIASMLWIGIFTTSFTRRGASVRRRSLSC